MRFYEISEAIQNKPYDLGLFVRNRLKETISLKAEFDRAETLINANTRNGEGMLRDWLRYGSENREVADNLDYLISVGRRTDAYFPLDQLAANLRAYLQHGPQFRRYIMTNFDYTPHLPPEALEVISILPSAAAGAQVYGFKPDDPENDRDEDYVEAMGLLQGLTMLAAAIPKAQRLKHNLLTKLAVVGHRANDQYRPEHEEVETLYHATAYCTEILHDGFQAEKPAGRRGLGNFGDQPTISFTHELEIARNLMRALKEIWMIAHGQLTAQRIVRWIRHENIEDKVRSTFGGDPNLDAMHTPIDAVRLYRYWLAFTKLRVDPWFVSPEELLEIMKTRDLKDIGVLACRVKLDAQDSYHAGEAEFRVAASKVQSVSRKL